MNYSQLVVHAKAVKIVFNKVFCRKPEILKTVDYIEDGISYITEDITIARFIRKQCCPTDQIIFNASMDSFDGSLISANYLKFYQELFEKQLMKELSYFQVMERRKEAIKIVRSCLLFVLKSKVLEPEL